MGGPNWMVAIQQLLAFRPRALLGSAVVSCLMLAAFVASGQAQTLDPVKPRLSHPRALYFQNNPGERARFMATLPRRPAGSPVASPAAVNPPVGGSWRAVTAAPVADLSNPLLLTDGTVIVHRTETQTWYRLKPSSTGDYATGTWTQIASLPAGYGPQYFASAVLPDGRVVINGGEYNLSGSTEVWTNLGAIYDPIANTWTSVAPPNGGTGAWTQIGDAQSVVLANGTYMLAACCANPSADALLNATNLTWAATGAPSNYQDEQGYTLLPDGRVLTINVWAACSPNCDANGAQAYNPGSGTWSSIATPPVLLVDPHQCGNFEIGPAVLRPDGTVVAFGGNTGCVAANPANPTAIYNVANNTWTQGPNVPQISSSYYDLADAPAALLPNGNILFAASPGYGLTPTHFFEFTSANAINQVADPLFFASTSGAYYYNFLLLPTGEVLVTDFSNTVEIYTPSGAPNSSWAPSITSVPSTLAAGQTYQLSGTQLNGLSQGAAYGDDVQGATNYPLVRITNTSTGHLFYARTFNHSTMSVAPNTAGSTNFAVPAGIELGASSLVVIANGIPSPAVAVTISTGTGTLAVAPASDIASSGPAGGPFSPSSFNYTVSTTSGTRSYSISGVPTWLTASSTSGTVNTTGTTVTFSVNSTANSLSPATYSATITFTDTTSNTTALTISATLTVNEISALQVSPVTNMASVGNPGGPFSPSSFQYQLSTNNGTVNYSVSGLPAWLNVSSASGTVSTTPITITFTVNSNANSLSIGGYNATISFANTTNGQGNQTRNAALTVNSGGTAPPAMRTWVSSTGNDGNDCTLTAPCLTFAGAISKAAAGGEIDCLDPGGFGGLTITKAIAIKCDGVEGGVLVSGTNGIVVSAASTDVVYLSGLDFEGLNSSLSGVLINAAGKVHIVNCVIRGFNTAGVNVAPSSANVAVDIIDTIIADNPGIGIFIKPTGSTSVHGFLDRTRVTNSGSDGVFVNANVTTGNVTIAVRDSESTNNVGNGFGVFSGGSVAQLQIDSSKASHNGTGIAATGPNAIARFTRSTVAVNGIGADQSSGGSILSYMTNSIDGNGSLGSFGTTAQQ
jgi:hypothetical protein